MHTPVSVLTADQLLQCYRKSRRTGNWRRLYYREKALFRASLDYLRHGGRILNESLRVKLERLIERLRETRGQRIVKRGLAKAAAILKGVENGISVWLLELKTWLKDPDYIFWLGTMARI